MANKSSQELGLAPTGQLLWKFSWPSILAMLCNSLYNIVDRAFVGRGVGPLAIAATTVAFPIMILFMGISLLIGVGATALISIRLGEQKKEEAELVAANAITLLVLLPLILSIIYLMFAEPILKFFGASAEVMPYAYDFTTIVILGSVLGSVGMGVNNFIRAEGNPIRAMSTQVLGAIINIILNYFFIFKLGIGIKGSALATVLGQLFATIWVMSYYLTGRSLVKLKLKNFLPKLPIVLKIMSIGFAPFSMQLASCIQQLILNRAVLKYSGDLGLSTVGIIMSIGTLMFMPILGISQGAQPIIGYNYGARQFKRVKETLKKAIFASSIIAVAAFTAIHLWPQQIAGIFTKDNFTLTKMTADALQVFFGMTFVIGFQIVCSQYFQAVGKALQAALLSLSRQFLLFIPLLLILPRFWGIKGVWRTAPIADAISVLLTAVFIIRELSLLPEDISEQNTVLGKKIY
ncbi:MAG: MATE family efflux transporter [Clostridia bacterium]|nr:MATE family efflux transporter [Clostridia bacterium]